MSVAIGYMPGAFGPGGQDPWGVATFASGRFLQDQFGHRSGLGGRP